jgi:hypothetical protein
VNFYLANTELPGPITGAISIVLTSGGGTYSVDSGDCTRRPSHTTRTRYRCAEGTDVAEADPCVADPSLVWSENGDGTVTQCSSGLVWEMKTDDGTIHDKDDKYTWSTGSPYDFDGTAKTDFIDVLNDVSGGGAACFAGDCGWRLPTIEELSGRSDWGLATGGIVDQSAGQCASGGACTTIPGETVSYFYRSSSSSEFSPALAWAVDFRDGEVLAGGKNPGGYFRAVRGGP